MRIIIELKNKTVKLVLKKREKVFDEIIFLQEENISQKLLPFFDEILKRNKLMAGDIERISIDTDLEENYTSRRIAQTFVNSFDYFKSVKSTN
jgi:hypothetical protein